MAFLRSAVCFRRHGTVNRATPVPSRTAEILLLEELTHILLVVRMLLNSALITWSLSGNRHTRHTLGEQKPGSTSGYGEPYGAWYLHIRGQQKSFKKVSRL